MIHNVEKDWRELNYKSLMNDVQQQTQNMASH